VRGTVAVERGPLVYCVESVDLPAGLDLDRVAVVTSTPPVDVTPSDGPEPLAVQVLVIAAAAGDPPPWPYRSDRPVASAPAREAVRMIPFYARANRGPAPMRVFLPEHPTED
jgi:DUF1680 family protein